MANYSARGYEIFTPMGNSRADFVAIKGDQVEKIQVKSAATRRYHAKDRSYTLAVLTTTRNGISTPYGPKEIDEFFIVGTTTGWIIPNELVAGRKTIMLESNLEGYEPRHGMDTRSWRVNL